MSSYAQTSFSYAWLLFLTSNIHKQANRTKELVESYFSYHPFSEEDSIGYLIISNEYIRRRTLFRLSPLMGNRNAKKASPGPLTGVFRRKQKTEPKPFPVINAQSYVPGSAPVTGDGGLYPPYAPPSGASQYPPAQPAGRPPMVNYNPRTGPLPPPPPPSFYNPMTRPRGGPHPISYPNTHSLPIMQRPTSFYNPRRSYRPPGHISRRYSSRRCRPVVHIIRADSCSSISTCSSISSCSSRGHRSRSYSRACPAPQQPIIFLPIQCQQPSSISHTNSTPIIIQPLNSAPQLLSTGKPQQLRAGPIQYVQAAPKSASTSQLQYIPVTTHTSVAPQRVLVNSTNKK